MLCVASTNCGVRDLKVYKENSFPSWRAFPQIAFCISIFKCTSQKATIYNSQTSTWGEKQLHKSKNKRKALSFADVLEHEEVQKVCNESNRRC